MVLRVLCVESISFLLIHQFINNRNDKAVQEGRCQQTSQDDLRHRTLDFITWQITTEGQWNQGQGGGQCGHENRIQTVEGAFDDAFLQLHTSGTKVVVVADEQHTVTGGNTEQRDETV